MGNILNNDKLLLAETVRYVHLDQADLEKSRYNKRYKDNSVRTGKYSWWNFVPLNLLEQFKKAPNIYFLIIAFLQTITLISISNGKAAMAPSLVQVVLVSMLKDAYEEYKKHKNDEKENSSKCQVFDSNGLQFLTKTWK